jgi:hypothetical protein
VTAQANTDAGSMRNAIRWGLLLAAVATIGFRLPRLVNCFRSWREALQIGDSSGAAGWRTFLYVESIGLVIVLVIGLVFFFVLRPRSKSQP